MSCASAEGYFFRLTGTLRFDTLVSDDGRGKEFVRDFFGLE